MTELKALQRPEIPVTVVDLEKIVTGEYAENTERKDFTWTESVEIERAVKPLEEAAAKERQVRKPVSGAKLAPQNKGKTRDKVAKATGKKRTSLGKAAAVVEAAEADSEKFGHLPDQMDESGKVEPAFKEMQIIKARAEYEERAEPGGRVEDLHALVASGKRFDRESARRRELRAQRKAARGARCAGCGAKFNGKRKDARFCSDACRQRAHRMVRGSDALSGSSSPAT
jgi:hypothetical protein